MIAVNVLTVCRQALLLMLLLGLGVAQAQGITLSDYVTDSVSRHPRVLEQVHIFRQSQQDQTIGSSGWRPSVDLSAANSRIEGDSPTVVGSQGSQATNFTSERYELSVTQNLFNGFDTRNRIKQTDARMHSALFELYDTADNIALDAIQAYVEVLKQTRLLKLAEENVVSHEETLRKIKRRSRSGAGRRSQLEQTEGRVARARAGLIAQKNNLQDALTEAHRVLGRYLQPNQLIEPKLPKHPGSGLEGLIDQALLQHPALKVAQYNIDAARYDQRRAHSKRYPKVDLKLAKEMGKDLNGIPGDTDETSLTLNLQYNFYNGGADRAERYKKISVVHEQQQFSARVRRQVINTLHLAWMADQSLNEQLKFLKQHVIQSQKTMVSYREEFFIGQRDLIDLLDVKNELNSAQNRYTEAYYEALAARYRILEGIGRLFEGLGLEPRIENDDLYIARVQAQGRDVLPLNQDLDSDNETDGSDHCDNSLSGSRVSSHGCLIAKPPTEQANDPEPATNTPPDAVDDQLELVQNGVLALSRAMLLKNDTDADGDNLVIEEFTQPSSGKLALNAERNLVYRAAEDFIGTDTFTYTIVDDHGAMDTAVVSVVIPPETDIDFSKTHYVNFLFSKSDLTASSQDKVKHIIKAMKAHPKVTVSIYAYTDNIGSNQYNLELSKRRANTTRKVLIAAGITAGRIQAHGGGEDNPIADNDSKEGQAINRRGELIFNTGSHVDG